MAKIWNGSVGNWFTAASWNPVGVPGSTNSIRVRIVE